MRRNKRARISANAWLFGLGVPVITLFALFSLMPYSAIMARWPLGVGDREKEYFQQWFDQRPSAVPDTVKAELYSFRPLASTTCAFEGNATGKDVEQLLAAEGFTDTVRIAQAEDGHWTLRTQEGELFRGQGEVELRPATVADLAAKYLEVIAAELEVPAPSASFVRVEACGKDLGIHLAQGTIGSVYLKRHHMAHRALVRMPLGAEDMHAIAVSGRSSAEMNDAVQQRLRATASARNLDELAAIMDVPRFASLVLLSQVRDGAQAPQVPSLMTYDAGEGLFHPLFDPALQPVAGERSGITSWGMGALLGQPAFTQLVKDLAQKVRSNEAQLNERLDLVDRTWLPILAQGKPVGMVEAQVRTIREAMLQRLWNADPVAAYGAVHALPGAATLTEAGPVLDPWLDPFRQEGDTLRFVRGKYTIDHDLVIPKGYSLVLEKGTRFFIAPGKSIVVNGTLIARGTGLNPVFIRPLEEGAPYGTLAVMGNGQTRCTLRGVLMSGGRGAWVNGVHFEGMLSAHRADLSLESCVVTEGPISVSHGALSIQGSSIAGEEAGGVQVAYGSAVLKECSFAGSGAWDSSLTMQPRALVRTIASKLLVDRCRFVDVRGGAVQANEASQLFIAHSTFERVARPLQAYDLSVVHVEGNTFTGNGVLFTGRCADPVHGGAYFNLYTNNIEGNLRERELDAASTCVSKGTVEASVRQAFGVDKSLEDRPQSSVRRGRRRAG